MHIFMNIFGNRSIGHAQKNTQTGLKDWRIESAKVHVNIATWLAASCFYSHMHFDELIPLTLSNPNEKHFSLPMAF